MMKITIIGAGLAGCEAACYLAARGHKVDLIDMKPKKFTKAHTYAGFAELVCSNSLKAEDVSSASGLLKAELRTLGSAVMEAADSTRVEAGGALAVNRYLFSDYITDKISSLSNINVICDEVNSIYDHMDGILVIATGPLTTDELCDSIKRFTGQDYLHFYDAASPIISNESIDHDIAFAASRYDKGTPDYLNCPMDKEQYDMFYNALMGAKKTELNEIDKGTFFEGCMPIEELARRGYSTPLFGPMKPVGITDPKNPEKRIVAVVQLRKENKEGTMYNLVGFQTRLTFSEQKRVFRLIPGLENCEFLRYGVIHRNTFIDSPRVLDKYYRSRIDRNIFFAGQISGVEGYLESTASGLYAAMQIDRMIKGRELIDLTSKTCIGALANYISNGSIIDFQPMNANFGIMEELNEKRLSKKEKKAIRASISLQTIKDHLEKCLNNK